MIMPGVEDVTLNSRNPPVSGVPDTFTPVPAQARRKPAKLSDVIAAGGSPTGMTWLIWEFYDVDTLALQPKVGDQVIATDPVTGLTETFQVRVDDWELLKTVGACLCTKNR
jgi:hypothetical protein